MLVLLQKNVLNFIVSSNKVSREVYRHFAVTLFLGSLNSDLVYRRYQYKGGDTEIISYREIYCALCGRMSMSHMLLFFRIKHLRISEKICRGLKGHTRQPLLMVGTFSAHDEWTVWDFVNFLFTNFAKAERYCNIVNWHRKWM